MQDFVPYCLNNFESQGQEECLKISFQIEIQEHSLIQMLA